MEQVPGGESFTLCLPHQECIRSITYLSFCVCRQSVRSPEVQVGSSEEQRAHHRLLHPTDTGGPQIPAWQPDSTSRHQGEARLSSGEFFLPRAAGEHMGVNVKVLLKLQIIIFAVTEIPEQLRHWWMWSLQDSPSLIHWVKSRLSSVCDLLMNLYVFTGVSVICRVITSSSTRTAASWRSQTLAPPRGWLESTPALKPLQVLALLLLLCSNKPFKSICQIPATPWNRPVTDLRTNCAQEPL